MGWLGSGKQEIFYLFEYGQILMVKRTQSILFMAWVEGHQKCFICLNTADFYALVG